MDEPGDDDKTPPRGKRPRSEWGDDRRAAVGRDHRAAESGPVITSAAPSTASERRRAAQRRSSQAADMIERELGPVPEDLGGREITEPWEILDSELHPDEERIVQRSKRESSDPLTVADGAKMLRRFIRKELDDRSAEKQRANEYLAILDTTPSGKLAARVTTLEKRSSTWNKVIGAVLVLVAGGLLTFLDRFWDRSAHETEMKFRLQSAEKTIERLDATIDRLERRINTVNAPAWAPQHSNKDPQP